MKTKDEVFNILIEKKLLDDCYKPQLSWLKIIDEATQLNLIGGLESYKSGLGGYENYDIFYVCNSNFSEIVQIPYSESCSTGFAHSVPYEKEITNEDISFFVKKIDFQISNVLHISRNENCNSRAFWELKLYTNPICN
jgi:hypothetical protein